jgi:preprotein translocase subunit Sec61beta
LHSVSVIGFWRAGHVGRRNMICARAGLFTFSDESSRGV